jgi:hypothetical protein
MDYQELRFEFAPTSSCSVIQVQDVSPWPMAIFPFLQRTDVGLALIWTNGIDNYADFSNPVNGLWTINFPQNGIWNVHMIMCVDQSTLFTVDAGNVRYYNGAFYLALQNQTPITNLPPDVAYWQLLDANDLNVFLNYVEVGGDIPYGQFHLNWVVNCDENNEPEELADNGNIINSACHLFSVINPLPDNGRNVVVKVYPFDMSEVLQCGIIDVVAGSTSIDFTTPEDNVYVFQIGYQPAGTTDCEIDYEDLYLELPKYDFCDVQSCFFKLTQMLLCNELDPCCQNCDPAFIEQRKIYREELNKMLALMLTLYGFLNVDQLNYLHFNQLYSYDMSSGEFTPLVPDRNMLIGKIQDIINKLRDIAGRCGDCNGPRENLTATQPCTNCGGSR